jgi:hypothetical protein
MEKHYLNNQRGDVCDSVLTQRFEGFKKHMKRGCFFFSIQGQIIKEL